jgi:HK97 family phage portal protein
MWISKLRADSGGGSDRSVFGNFWFDTVGRMSSSGVRVTPDRALALSSVWSCVRVLSESFAIMPFRMFTEPFGGGGRVATTSHWLYKLFCKAPNRFQSPFEWREMLQGHLVLRGNAFCQIERNGAGEIVELLPLHPDRIKIEVLPNNSYRYIYTDQNAQQIVFLRSEIWHLRGLSSDGYVGLSPIDVARENIGEGLAMQDYSARYFANDAKPGGGWIEFPGKFATPAAKQVFREGWQSAQGGGNKNKVAVLEGGMKFHEVGINNADSQFIESRAAKVSDVARIFRIPPHKIGDLSKATFSNIEQQAIEFWQDTMLPWSERWESSIESQLLGPDTEFDVEFDMRRMQRGDSTARGIYYQSGIQSGWLLRNEAREEEGLDPIDGLSEPLVPLNMQTPAQIDQTAELAEQAADAAADSAANVPADPAQDTVDTTDSADARLATLVQGNAARMARRIVAGSVPESAVLADALAVHPAHAVEWLANRDPTMTEAQITEQLCFLGM